SITDKSSYFPSASVFVYTLPNIVAGEIAIRQKLNGENAFFIYEQFSPAAMREYCDILLELPHVSSVLCGWVDVDGSQSEAFVYWVKKSNFNDSKAGFCKS